jgi:hypothetical protein
LRGRPSESPAAGAQNQQDQSKNNRKHAALHRKITSPVIILELVEKRKAPRKAVDYPMNQRP